MTLNYLIFASPEHVYISVNGRLISTHNRAKMFEDFKQTYSEEGVAKFFNTYGILPVMFHAAMDGDGRRKSLPATLIEIQWFCRPHPITSATSVLKSTALLKMSVSAKNSIF